MGQPPWMENNEPAKSGSSWVKKDEKWDPGDYYDFEKKEADRLKGWRHPGSGNGAYYKLDSSCDDYLTDNKVVGLKSDVKSFSINRDQWRKDRDHARNAKKQLRMSVLFVDRHKDVDHPDRELHVVVVEGNDFYDKYDDSLVLRKLLENHPELIEEANDYLN